jgi:hypothetical protein
MKIPKWNTEQQALIKGQIEHYQRMLKSDDPAEYTVNIGNCVFCRRAESYCNECPNRLMKECNFDNSPQKKSVRRVLIARRKYSYYHSSTTLKAARKAIRRRIRQLQNWLKQGG